MQRQFTAQSTTQCMHQPLSLKLETASQAVVSAVVIKHINIIIINNNNDIIIITVIIIVMEVATNTGRCTFSPWAMNTDKNNRRISTFHSTGGTLCLSLCRSFL